MPKNCKEKTSIDLEDKRASVTYKLGFTKSMGQYESLRIDFGITMPCHESKITQTAKKIKKLVEKELDKELSRYA